MIGNFTQEEFEKLKERIDRITTFLPESEMSFVWQSVTKLRGDNQPQPCSCKSSAGHWTRAIDDLKEFVKENQ